MEVESSAVAVDGATTREEPETVTSTAALVGFVEVVVGLVEVVGLVVVVGVVVSLAVELVVGVVVPLDVGLVVGVVVALVVGVVVALVVGGPSASIAVDAFSVLFASSAAAGAREVAAVVGSVVGD